MNISNNKILITGGASGIGLGLTERFLEEGNSVIVCGRRADVLDDLRERYPAVVTRRCDLTDEADRAALYEWIASEHADLDVLVNNAGIQNWMDVADEDFFARAQTELATNVEAPLHLTALFLKLPALRTIVNVTSGLSFVPLTKAPVYSATKAFFHSFTVSLRHLLENRGVEVVEIIPPAINTDLGGKGLHDHAPPVADFVAAVFDQLKAGKTDITFGLSEAMANAGPNEAKEIFRRLNT
ncbi:MAG: SDR family NAD(P)-dependent oxidoreductase [Acidobacteria bacterium]|nr:SDR family NAD(P)-dependent oxidoreductase [Acidobacteriota bacterium]